MTDYQTAVADFYICKAFKEIVSTSPATFHHSITNPSYQDVRDYLAQLPQSDRKDPAKMANHITGFCQQTGHEALYDWLGNIYDRLDSDGINSLVKKPRDPGDEADDEPGDIRLIRQKSRDICQDLQQLAANPKQSRNLML